MSDLNNIDKLLKDNFVDFTPDAPDVWQGIQQGVQAAQAAQATGTITAAVKGTSIVVKLIAVAAIGVSAVTGYVLVKNNIPIAQQEQQLIPKSPDPAVEAMPQTIVHDMNEQESVTKPETLKKEKKQHLVSKPEKQSQEAEYNSSKAASAPTVQSVIIDPKETVKSDIKTEEKTLESSVPQVVKKDHLLTEPQEKVVPKPYNPNAEGDYVKPIITNVFTPNGDGVNDKFVIPIDNEQFYSLMILDKNGNLVFESNDKNIQWDGRDYKSGAICESGIYYMVFRYQYKDSQTEHKTTGKIKLIN